ATLGADGDAHQRILRGEHRRMSTHERRGLRLAAGVALDGTIRVPREEPGRLVERVALAEIGRGQEIEIETGPARQCRRERTTEVQGDAHALALGGDLEAIAEGQIRVAGIGDQLVGSRTMLARGERWNRIPLLRSGTESDLAVGRDPLAVQDHLDAAELLIAE